MQTVKCLVKKVLEMGKNNVRNVEIVLSMYLKVHIICFQNYLTVFEYKLPGIVTLKIPINTFYNFKCFVSVF